MPPPEGRWRGLWLASGILAFALGSVGAFLAFDWPGHLRHVVLAYLSVFLIDASQIQAEPQEWDALGLRGNQSGSLLVDWGFVPDEQLVGPIGDGAASNDESVDPNFLIGSSGVWSGIALGAIDNLGKGAAGQAVQNANLLCDLPETTGLEGVALWP